MSRTLFHNGRLFTGERIEEGRALLVEDGAILDILPASESICDAEEVDLRGGLLTPGFIDVQVNGGGGVLFNDAPDVPTLKTILATHRRFGVTGLLPTLISDEWSVMVRAAKAIRQGIAQGLPGLLGIHFEGPYISPLRKGVHSAERIRNVDHDALPLFTAPGLGVVMVTVAPEETSVDFIKALAQAGVRVCAGHSAADYETTKSALDAGVSCFTHLFNAMSPLDSRAPGVVGAALENESSWCGVIVDGAHVHYATLRIALRAKQPGKVMLITDAMPSVGAESKSFHLQGRDITVKDGRCTSENGVLAGADLDMATAVRNAAQHLPGGLEEALRMASLYPAQFLGMGDKLGRLAPGYQADLTLLDEQCMVLETWIGGTPSHSNG